MDVKYEAYYPPTNRYYDCEVIEWGKIRSKIDAPDRLNLIRGNTLWICHNKYIRPKRDDKNDPTFEAWYEKFKETNKKTELSS